MSLLVYLLLIFAGLIVLAGIAMIIFLIAEREEIMLEDGKIAVRLPLGFSFRRSDAQLLLDKLREITSNQYVDLALIDFSAERGKHSPRLEKLEKLLITVHTSTENIQREMKVSPVGLVARKVPRREARSVVRRFADGALQETIDEFALA